MGQDGSVTAPAIRLADPALDAESVAVIYRPAVERSVASFEEAPPTAAGMSDRMRATLERLPWLVAESAGEVVGYAYAGPHRSRPGYRWSVEISVYVAPERQSEGIGRTLYDRLLEILRRQGYVNVYAGLTLPNPASERLHEAIGMRRIGVYERIGYKFDAWHDVAWYGLRLADPEGPPAEPIPLPQLDSWRRRGFSSDSNHDRSSDPGWNLARTRHCDGHATERVGGDAALESA
jgi:L-amino acid N-acyltransferase YncA